MEPTVPVFNREKLGYYRPLCEACPNYPPDEETAIVYADMQWSDRQERITQQHSARMNHLDNKLNEHIDTSKKRIHEKLFIQKS